MTAFFSAVRNGDLEQIRALHPRLRAINAQSQEFIFASNILATNGYEEGANGLEILLDSVQVADNWGVAVAGLVKYHQVRKTAAEFLARREETLAAMIDDVEHLPTPADRAFIANQLGITAENAGDDQKSARYTQRAIDLEPQELVYRVNLAISLEAFDLKAAEAEVDRYMKLPEASTSGFALDQAFDVYVTAKRTADAKKVLDLLEAVDPGRAAFKTFAPS